MSDGPFCVPTDKYYGHSKLHYPNSDNALRNPNKFGHLWSKAKLHAENNQTNALKLSDDKGAFVVGVQVLE